MKTIAILGLSFLVPAFAFAASGACSGHGGVNCSAGRDGDGSVICTDGWRNSSVSYSSMVKCAGYDVSERPIEKQAYMVSETTPTPKSTPLPVVISKPKTQSGVQEIKPNVEVKPIVSELIVQKEVVPVGEVVPTPTKKGFWSRMFSLIF